MSAFARAHSMRLFLMSLLLLLLVLAVGPAAAQVADSSGGRVERSFGFVQPPDYEREFQQHLKIYAEKRDLPSNFSWVDLDGVTSVKNQSSCGSCWAFAGIAQLEAHVKIEYGIDMDLSEQQIIECNPYGADCGGGWASAVYNVAMTYGVLRNAAEPYENANGGACTQGQSLPFAHLAGWNYVANDITQMKNALLEGPICSAMDGSYPFDEYAGGTCYDNPGGSWTNHLILIVGWDDRLCGGNGAWICKNSWGTDFGDYGFFTSEYGAGLIGQSVTQINYVPPPTVVHVTGPLATAPMTAGETVDITWNTTGATCSTVDIWMSFDNGEYSTQVADGVPNSGSYTWTVINQSTQAARFCVVANGDTRDGFGFSQEGVPLFGYKTRYVAATGSNTAPYDTPAKAAHDMIDAVQACTGHDSVLVAAGEYLETILVESTVRIFGGWDNTFTTRDPVGTPTRLRGLNSAVRFMGAAGDFAGIDGVVFHDCIGAMYDTPAVGRHGGAILCNGTSPTISNCVFENCAADYGSGFGTGGAIQALGGSPKIIDNVFQNNRATWGGAVALFSPVAAELSGNHFVANNCVAPALNNFGAAVYVSDGAVSFSGDLFENSGSTWRGAGVYGENVQMSMVGVVATGNTSQNDGGAVFLDGGSLNVANSRFASNTATAGFGAGMSVKNAAQDLRNSEFVGNSAGVAGGGMRLEGALATTIENCVFHGNSDASNMGGAFLIGVGPMSFRNNTVTGNTGGLGGSMTTSSIRFSTFWDNGGSNHVGFTPETSVSYADPMYKNAAAGEFGLLVHSPCIDAGDHDPTCGDLDGTRNDVGCFGGPSAVPVAPEPPSNVRFESPGGVSTLVWDASPAADLDRYVIYRDAASSLPLGPTHVIAEVSHPATSLELAQTGGSYFVVAVDVDGYGSGYPVPAVVSTAADDAPRVLALASIAPNPFNPRTEIRFEVPRTSDVRLRIHDLRGRVVRTLIDGAFDAGVHTVSWEGRSDDGAIVAAGVYFVRIEDGREVRTGKVVLAK